MINVKICGITRIEDALIAEELGAWAIGFVFYKKSVRYITPKKAREISNNLKNQNTKKVGVFVNEKPEIINKIADEAQLDYVQLHGNETPNECDELNIPFIKAVRTVEELDSFPKAFAFLVDAVDAQNWGGTGKLSDWDFAKIVKKQKTLMLSGGLSSVNIKQAVETVEPDFIDVSSSLELSHGIKNHSAMFEFFDVVQELSKGNGL